MPRPDHQARGADNPPAPCGKAALRRFELDSRAERQLAGARQLASAGVAVGAVWLAAVGTHMVHHLLAAAGGLATLGWWVVARRIRRRVASGARHYLALHDDVLEVAQGERTLVLPWDQVRSVEVDEERLVVVLERCSGSPLTVEPLYRGVGLYELRDAIAAVWSAFAR